MTEDTVEVFEDEEVVTEEVAEQDQDTTDEIREAFDGAITDEADEDAIKMAMIGAGATFKNVTRLYNKFMIDAGLAISKEDRNAIVDETLEGRDFASEEDFNSAVEALVEAITGSTERSAAGLVRSYAKKNELECYVKPKGQGGSRSGFASKFYDFLLTNPSEEEAKAYINGEGDNEDTSDNVKKHMSHYMGIWGLANKIHNA